MSLYEIAFAGQLVPGAQAEQVKENLARLFQADAQRIALLFSGRRIVIKSNLDATEAEKYRATLERAGALAIVQSLGEQIEEIELAPAPPAHASAGTAPASSRVVPRDEYMAAFSTVEAPDFGIAPLGSDLQDDKPKAAATSIDLAQFSLAPVGSDIGEAKPTPVAPPLDTSHLKLQ